jgi:ATP-dependent Clp protease ATP-binding subunit ClpC
MEDARDLAQCLAEAEDIASTVGQRPTTAHLLLAVFTVPCPAAELLKERGVDEDRILAAMTRAPKEPETVSAELLARTREIAAGVGAAADTLHLLIAMSRQKDCLAYQLLARCNVPLAALRNTILGWFTGGRMPRQYQPPAPPPPPPPRRAPPPRGPRQPAPPRVLAAHEILPDPRTAPVPAAPDTAVPRSEPEVRPAPAPAAREEPEARPALAPEGRAVPEVRPAAAPAPRAKPEPRPASAPAPRGAPAPRPAPVAVPVDLDPARFPTLAALGKNLTRLAADRRLDPVIGRDAEVEETVDILGKRRGNNPMLLGEPGTGKTAIAEGVAQRLLELARRGLPARIVVELDVAALVAGTALRGAFSERLNALKDEVRKAAGQVVVFIDEIHTLIGAGSTGDGPGDAANELKAALARGEFPCIGATTHDEYRKFIEGDPALERRFTPVLVREPTVDQAAAILRGVAPRYAEHHGVSYTDEALEAAAAMSARYISDRCLPDKAIQVIDLAGSRCRRAGMTAVDVRAVAEVVARMAKLPAERLLVDDRERLLRLEEELGKRVVGHREVIARVAAAVRRNYAGFAARRPMGSFLFLGPTGVGKTELARALAEILHGTADALVRLDMSEFGEAHSAARLLGAPPGYVGYGEGGQLTEPVRRRPACVVLLDEFEKAHRDVQLLLLQVLDEGRLTDGRGRHVDFGQTIVVLTSNLGAEAFAGGRSRAVGFAVSEAAAAPVADERIDRALESARGQLPPELWGRIDERCVFAPLSRDEVAAVARLLVADSARRLAAERRVRFTVGDEVIDWLLDSGGYEPALGARPMRQTVQRLLEAPLAEAILRGEVHDGEALVVRIEDGGLRFARAR